jgi:hypothetical protein
MSFGSKVATPPPPLVACGDGLLLAGSQITFRVGHAALIFSIEVLISGNR